MDPLFFLEAVGKRYGDREVLSVPSLEIREGSFLLLTGPNGSGKTTLLSILAFLLRPTAGKLFYAGRRVDWKGRSLVALRREVTLLHQSPYLFEETVDSNVAYGLNVRGIEGGNRKERVDEALKMVGLQRFGDRRARALSGGEMQRVALARALAISPRVLLLDEPLANVDRESAEVIRGIISGLPARGTTVLMATHDPDRTGGGNGGFIRLEEGKLSQGRCGAGGFDDRKMNDRAASDDDIRRG
ncbi:MAG: ABC transporter ATP-binding protein [Deltaproteobacteria bacterium]|nr:ABC transporter ATP-binding protein [Deltaproteobacteria bacterium]